MNNGARILSANDVEESIGKQVRWSTLNMSKKSCIDHHSGTLEEASGHLVCIDGNWHDRHLLWQFCVAPAQDEVIAPPMP